MDSATLEESLRAFYIARTENDPDACQAFFAKASRLHYVGSPEASAFAQTIDSREEVDAVVQGVVQLWKWTRCEILDLLIDGHKAAVRFETDVVHTQSGQSFTTQLMDLWTFDADGAASTLTEFADTAMIAQIMER